MEQFKYIWGIYRMTCITVKPAFSASSPFSFCTEVWSDKHHSQTRKQSLSHLQSCPPTLSLLLLLLLYACWFGHGQIHFLLNCQIKPGQHQVKNDIKSYF